MILALSCAIGVFLLGFFCSLLYSSWHSQSFPWFQETHKKIMYWRNYDTCMKLTILLSIAVFFVVLYAPSL